MKTLSKILITLALAGCAAMPEDAPTPFTNTFSPEKVIPNRTGWSWWFLNTNDPGDTLNVKISYVDTLMASHSPHRHNHDELFVILEGEPKLHMNGVERVLHPGDGVYCPGGSSHNIQRTDPNKAIKYLMVTRETRGGVPEPIPYYKENYTYDDCYVPFQEGKSFWYVKPGDSKGGVNVESILVNNKRVHKDKADGRQLVYVILEGSAKVTVDGVPVELSAQSACYVPKGSAGTIAATTTPMRYLQVRTQ